MIKESSAAAELDSEAVMTLHTHHHNLCCPTSSSSSAARRATWNCREWKMSVTCRSASTSQGRQFMCGGRIGT
eukprot:5550-Eustigmatos_ZCMA.PRE.1